MSSATTRSRACRAHQRHTKVGARQRVWAKQQRWPFFTLTRIVLDAFAGNNALPPLLPHYVYPTRIGQTIKQETIIVLNARCLPSVTFWRCEYGTYVKLNVYGSLKQCSHIFNLFSMIFFSRFWVWRKMFCYKHDVCCFPYETAITSLCSDR